MKHGKEYDRMVERILEDEAKGKYDELIKEIDSLGTDTVTIEEYLQGFHTEFDYGFQTDMIEPPKDLINDNFEINKNSGFVFPEDNLFHNLDNKYSNAA